MAVTVGVLLVTSVALVAWWTDTPAGIFTRDQSATTGTAWYTGSVSSLNLVLWGVAAALATFVASLHRANRGGLLIFAGFSAVLLADDALLLHEFVGPRLQVPEPLFFVVYAAAAGMTVWLLSPARAGTAGWAVLLGGGLLAASIGTDIVVEDTFLLEDGLKLVGTMVWATVPVLAHLHTERVRSLRELEQRRSTLPVENTGRPSTIDLRDADRQGRRAHRTSHTHV